MTFESLGLRWGWEIERLIKIMDWKTPDNMYIRTQGCPGRGRIILTVMVRLELKWYRGLL